MGKNPNSVIFSLVLVLVSLIIFSLNIFWYKYRNLNSYNPNYYKNKYLNSQWVISGSDNPISDEELYSYAAYEYIKGVNPILINPEVPPLGKYLIGLSIAVFNNQHAGNFIAGLISLVSIFVLVYLSTDSIISGSLATFLTTVSTVFHEQLIHVPQLDIFQLLFFVSFSVFFVAYQKTANFFYLIFSGIFFGFFISVKFFLFYFLLLDLTLVLFYLFRKSKINYFIKDLFFINFFGLVVYLLTYFRYFVLGGNFRGFLGVQKWIWTFYSQSQIDMSRLWGNYLNLIFFNKWKFWSGDYPVYPYKYWTIVWPIFFVLGSLSLYPLLKKKDGKHNIKDLVRFLLAFLLVYNGFLFFTPIYPRYLLLLFIPLNILLAIYFGRLIQNILVNIKFKIR